MVSEPAGGAFIRELVAVANRIVQEDIEPQDGAGILARACANLWSLEEALGTFVALDEDWKDLPEQRVELAREIVKAADRFRAQWGP
jgi:hypothetical protein